MKRVFGLELCWCGLLRHLFLTVDYATLQGTKVCQIRINRGQMIRDHTLPLLKRMAKPSDIAVINFA